MNIGDVVVFKGQNSTNNKNIGYIYSISKNSNEAKIEWNFGAYEWENIDSLEILDMNDDSNIKLFKELFIENKKNKNAVKDFDDYLEWVCTYNGKYMNSDDILTFCNKTYEKVEFLKYNGRNITDKKFNRKYTKIYSKDKFLIYSTTANGCYYDYRICYLVDKDNSNVYFIGLKNKYTYDGSYCPYKELKKNIENYYYNLETSDYQKEKDKENINMLYSFLYEDKSSYIKENKIITEKQVIYIAQLMERLYKEFVRKNKLEYINKFIYNENLKLHLLNTTELFKNMDYYIDVQNAIIVLKNPYYVSIYMKKDETNEVFDECMVELKDYYIL